MSEAKKINREVNAQPPKISTTETTATQAPKISTTETTATQAPKMSTTKTTATQAPRVRPVPIPVMGRSAAKKIAERKASTRPTPIKALGKKASKKSIQQAPQTVLVRTGPNTTQAVEITNKGKKAVGKPITQIKVGYKKTQDGGSSGSASSSKVKRKLK